MTENTETTEMVLMDGIAKPTGNLYEVALPNVYKFQLTNSPETVTVDIAEIMAHGPIVEYIFKYGLRQCIRESSSQITKKAFPDKLERETKATKTQLERLAKLYAGDVPSHSESTGPRDPVFTKIREKVAKEMGIKKSEFGKLLPDWDAIDEAIMSKCYTMVELECNANGEAITPEMVDERFETIRPKYTTWANDVIRIESMSIDLD